MESKFKRRLRSIDRRIGLAAFESWFAANKLNVLLSIYICIRSFPLRQAIRLPFFVYGWPRIYGLSGMMRIEGRVRMGMIKFNRSMDGVPSVCSLKSELKNDGHVFFKGSCLVGTGCRIRIGVDGILEIGNNTKIADMCNVGCYSNITIGDTTRVAHRCQLLDSNYHYILNILKRTVSPRTKPIKIGNNCWICNTTTITGGSIIPDYTIVASNSLVGKNFSSLNKGSLIGGMPAKFITEGLYRIENKNKLSQIECFFESHKADMTFTISDDESLNDYI